MNHMSKIHLASEVFFYDVNSPRKKSSTAMIAMLNNWQETSYEYLRAIQVPHRRGLLNSVDATDNAF